MSSMCWTWFELNVLMTSSFISLLLYCSVMSISHRYSHPHSQAQTQAEALSQPSELLLSQPNLVLKLSLLHQQGSFHLHEVAGEKKQKYTKQFSTQGQCTGQVECELIPILMLTCSLCAVLEWGSGPEPGWRPALCDRRGPSSPEPLTAVSWADVSFPAGGATGQTLPYFIRFMKVTSTQI